MDWGGSSVSFVHRLLFRDRFVVSGESIGDMTRQSLTRDVRGTTGHHTGSDRRNRRKEWSSTRRLPDPEKTVAKTFPL